MMSKLLYETESHQIIGAAIEVHKEMGHGFLENVYQEALAHEFRLQKIPFDQERQLDLVYKGIKMTKFYIADFVCFSNIIVECKALGGLAPENESQVLNYLNATGFRLGLLINFGRPRIAVKRIIK